MSGNSLERVLETIKEINVTLGWGALVVCSCRCLNVLLERHYVERLGAWNCLPRFGATIPHEGGLIQVQAIEFGAPKLSFASATTCDRRVQVILPILSGTYRRESLSADDKLHYFAVNESMGFVVKIDIDLDIVAGRERQVLSLDLSNAVNMQCNLGLGDEADEALTAELLRWFQNLQHYQSRFVLMEADSQGDDGWTPTQARVYTQSAPGAQATEAANHGEGAVLMFFKVKGRARDGLAPTSFFPYLVVDDDGVERYPMIMVLDRALDHFPGQLWDKLTLRPEPFRFAEQARHQPFDTALFGRLVTQGLMLTVDEPAHTVRVDSEYPFILRDQQGEAVNASRWTVSGLEGQSGPYGEINPKQGLYRSMSPEQLKHEDSVIVVTANLFRDDREYRASVRVRVSLDLFELRPEVVIVTPGTPVELQTVGQGPGYRWKLLDEHHGRLQVRDFKQATFIPDAVVNKKGLVIQQIRVDSDRFPRFSIVMANGAPLLAVQPDVFRRVDYRETLQLEEQDPSFISQAKRRWTLFGVGELSEDGRFTAPPNGAPAFSVVTCEIEHHGVVLATGYNVLRIGRP